MTCSRTHNSKEIQRLKQKSSNDNIMYRDILINQTFMMMHILFWRQNSEEKCKKQLVITLHCERYKPKWPSPFCIINCLPFITKGLSQS